MATTLQNLIDECRTLVGDPSTVADTFDDAMVIDAVNWAINLFCVKTRATYKEVAMTAVTPGSVYALPVDYMKPLSVLVVDRYLDETLKTEADIKHPGWRGMQVQPPKLWPDYWFKMDGASIRIYPSYTDSISATQPILGYLQLPTLLVATTDVIDPRVPLLHRRHLRYASGAWLFQQVGDSQDQARSDSYLKIFDSLVGGLDATN